MSLRNDSQEELFGANNELKGFLPEDDPMMVFEKTIYPAFKDEDFKKFYWKDYSQSNRVMEIFLKVLVKSSDIKLIILFQKIINF